LQILEGLRNLLLPIQAVATEVRNLRKEVREQHLATKQKFDEIAEKLDVGLALVKANTDAILEQNASLKAEILAALAASGISAAAEDAIAARFDAIADNVKALGDALAPPPAA
jgi:hypothetical protein